MELNPRGRRRQARDRAERSRRRPLKAEAATADTRGPATSPRPVPSAPRPKTVLVCDNEEPLRALVTAALDGNGYRIVEARDGEESLALARAERPDVIVLDMMMPGRSGLEVLAELRRDPAFEKTRVLMLTARAQAIDRTAAGEAGADRFVPKPFSPLELAATVEELLEGAR